jgi:hypothetical protein
MKRFQMKQILNKKKKETEEKRKARPSWAGPPRNASGVGL